MDSSEGKRLLSELLTEQLFFSPCNLKIKRQCNGSAIYYTHVVVNLSPALECVDAEPNASSARRAACIWIIKYILSLKLSGTFNYQFELRMQINDRPKKLIQAGAYAFGRFLRVPKMFGSVNQTTKHNHQLNFKFSPRESLLEKSEYAHAANESYLQT